MKKSIQCQTLCSFLVFAAIAISAPAFAIDLLELPAIKSSKASSALLLDVVSRGEHLIAAAGQYGVIMVSDDDGASWMQASVPASVTLTGIHFPTPDFGWAVGHDGLILHSSDGGQNWQKQLDGHQLNEQIIAVAERIVEQVREELELLESGEEADESALEDAEYRLEEAEFMLEGAMDDTTAGPVRPLLDVWFKNTDEGFVTGSYGMLLHTSDGGKNWNLVSDRMNNPEAFHLNQIVPGPDGQIFIAGESGYVYRSSDGGESWETLEPGYSGSFYGLVIVPGEADQYELLAYGLRGNLFSSQDKGETWTEETSGTSVTLMSGVTLHDRTVVLAGQAGVILTRSPGQATFTVADNPDQRVISGVTQLTDKRLLLVGLGGVRLALASGAPIETANDTP